MLEALLRIINRSDDDDDGADDDVIWKYFHLSIR